MDVGNGVTWVAQSFIRHISSDDLIVTSYCEMGRCSSDYFGGQDMAPLNFPTHPDIHASQVGDSK